MLNNVFDEVVEEINILVFLLNIIRFNNNYDFGNVVSIRF